MIAPEPAAVPERADWDTQINQAAVQLLVGPCDGKERAQAVHGLLIALQDDQTRPAWMRDALNEAVSTLDEALNGSCATDVALQRVAAQLERIMEGRAPASATPSILSPTSAGAWIPADAARELFPEFLQESLDGLAQAESALLELEADASATEPLNVAFRAFHTIKGSAAFIGLDALSALAHDVESLLSVIRDGDAIFGEEHADILLGSADVIRELLELAQTHPDDAWSGQVPAGYASLRQSIADVLEQITRGEAEVAEVPVHVNVNVNVPVNGRSVVIVADSADAAAVSRSAAAPATGVEPLLATAPVAAAHSDDGWARVRTHRLDQLVDLAGELAIAHSMVAQDAALITQDRHGPLARKVLHMAKLVRELQDLSIGLRMVPLRPLFHRLNRLVRDLAHQSGKQIHFVMEGEDTEIDRTMVELLTNPLVHMIRNAVDHGFEMPAERAARGKPELATLRLTAQHEGGAVVVVLHDDGRGLDRNQILEKAVARGIVTPGQELTDAEIEALIFAPGLSTAQSVTELSGRGVGMDVVHRNIEAMGGRIEIASVPGAGTRFTLRLPLTLAVTDGMLVRVADERYIVPTFNILTSFRADPSALVTEARSGEFVMLHGQPVPIVRLHHVFGIDNAVTETAAALLVVITDGQERYALLVDELLGQHQFVAKPLAESIAVAGVAGSAVLGDGRVGLIIDARSLLSAARTLRPW